MACGWHAFYAAPRRYLSPADKTPAIDTVTTTSLASMRGIHDKLHGAGEDPLRGVVVKDAVIPNCVGEGSLARYMPCR